LQRGEEEEQGNRLSAAGATLKERLASVKVRVAEWQNKDMRDGRRLNILDQVTNWICSLQAFSDGKTEYITVSFCFQSQVKSLLIFKHISFSNTGLSKLLA
jgi:hypothetical protein